MSIPAPSRKDLVERCADIVPVLRSHERWAEENRRLHPETVEALTDAGVFRLRVPRRLGGLEVDTRTLVDVAAELARGDSAAAWVASVNWIPGWMACQFPDQTQDEVFADPDTRICGTLSPGGIARPVEGGIVVDGKWGFISGAHHAHWQEIIAVLAPEEGEPYPVAAMVPMSDLLVIDDWDTSGLRGTGSVSTVAQQLFVPAHRVLPLPMVLEGRTASASLRGATIYSAPLLPVAAASSVGTVLGIGRSARDLFAERLPSRKITYTGYASQKDAPVTHHRVAAAATALERAAFHADHVTSLVDEHASAGAEWKLEDRVRARADMGAVVELVKEAVDGLSAASGGSSIYRDVPMQRLVRDIHAISLHALMNPTTNAELYGRVLCGLEPDTLYV